MAILSIDTCLQSCGAAILANGKVLAVRQERREKGHAERLAPLVQELLEDTGLAVSDFTRIGVTVGPGSFTGVRVGAAFARGLAIGSSIEVVGITTLEALATGIAAHEGADRAVLIDARRGQVYGQIFTGTTLIARSDPFVLTPEQAFQKLEDHQQNQDLILAGSGVPLVFPERQDDFDWQAQQPDPVQIALLTVKKNPESNPPHAFYLRPADAKPAKPVFG